MNDMTEFQQRACSVAIVKMLRDRTFSICDLDAIGRTMGRHAYLAGRDYDALRSVHCVSWADMGPELTRQVQEKCLELLGLPPHTIDAVEEVTTERPTQAPQASQKLRLAFWRKA